jgi:DNA-binding IclR family transcriptional regulator
MQSKSGTDVARPAPSVDRTIRLLTFLADEPDEEFTLSELARKLEFNKATCHAMLTELVEGGVLLRHPARKTYALGPVLVSWGVAAAIDAYRALEFAEEELTALRDKMDATCVAVGLVGGEIVVLARRDVDRPMPSYVPVGHRVPAVPPFGGEFLAWATEEEIGEWIARLGLSADDPKVSLHLEELAQMRQLGYRASVSSSESLTELLETIRTEDRSLQFRHAVDEVISVLVKRGWQGDSPGTLLNSVIAPVFGPSGEPVLALSLSAFAEPVDERGMQRYVNALLTATGRITTRIGGTSPVKRGRKRPS